jgi:hypothetical protein
MMKYKVCELEGARLDAAVAKAKGWEQQECEGEVWWWGCDAKWRYTTGNAEMRVRHFNPSTDWSDGGPIIERERIGVYSGVDPYTGDPYRSSVSLWFASEGGTRAGRINTTGPTPLIAAMRAYVASKLGDEVELP